MEMPNDLTFRQEWQRIVFDADGTRWHNLDSGWWEDESIARSLLGDEYPNPTPTGFQFRLQTRWVSEHRMVPLEED